MFIKSKATLDRADAAFGKARSLLAKARYTFDQSQTASRSAWAAKVQAEGFYLQAYIAASVGAMLEDLQGDTPETESFQIVAEYAGAKAVFGFLYARVMALRYEAAVMRAQAASDKAESAMKYAESLIAKTESLIARSAALLKNKKGESLKGNL
jgi:hypothetical protein